MATDARPSSERGPGTTSRRQQRSAAPVPRGTSWVGFEPLLRFAFGCYCSHMARPPTHRLWATIRFLTTVLVAVSLLSWSQPPRPDPLDLSIGTGGTGGVYHVYGTGLAQVIGSDPDVRVTALTTAASVQNNRLVASGSLDVAFTLADVAALAVEGAEPFDAPLPITAIARLYDNHTHVVVRANSPYESVADLAGGTVSVGAMGSGTEMIAERLLGISGLDQAPGLPPKAPMDEEPPRDVAAPAGASAPTGVTRYRLSIGSSAKALEEERIDAFFWSGGLPTQAISDLAARVPIRLLDLSEDVPELIEEYGEFYSESPVPTGTYENVPAVRTIGVPSLLVANAHMPERTAETFTRLLFESQDALAEIHPVTLHLHPRSAIATLPVPLHPGATTYYRSVKYAFDGSVLGQAPPTTAPTTARRTAAGGSSRRSRGGGPGAGSISRLGAPTG